MKDMDNLYTKNAEGADLPALNTVIETAVMNWPMEERSKRLAVPVLQYDAVDMQYYKFHVTVFKEEIVGVAVWDPESTAPLPNGEGRLFHGLFVLPLVQCQGVGGRLMEKVFEEAKQHSVNGLLIKAQRVSRGYFSHQGLPALAVSEGDFPWQFWKKLA